MNYMRTKKNLEKQFDVLIGAFDGAVVCELIGLFNLSTINKGINFESIAFKETMAWQC